MELPAIFSALGSLAFIAAFVTAMKTYHKTREISSYWLVYSAGALLGAFWAGMLSLSYFGVYPEITGNLAPPIFAATATAFAIAALVTMESLVQPAA
ncbi:Uncharacterised protein [Candidatus Anstonella stagnisolia]|nr:Uncharacterised protein [Candidatus Anstonella stagnisolia]